VPPAKAGRRGDDGAMLGHTARQQRIADNLTRLQAYEDPRRPA
jgi:hypothetical protein